MCVLLMKTGFDAAAVVAVNLRNTEHEVGRLIDKAS